ncbi:MAG TPA: hypothetical protein VG710_07090 [Opitutus sp.]|nr:hypothetical protein [Opitutus sp.]
MQPTLISIVRDVSALGAGTLIGLAFGLLQQAALRRHEQRERTGGQLTSGWSLMPGAGARVAYLLLALALVQLVCPLLFVDGVQWVVSAGVAAGYGWTLYRRLRPARSPR